MDKPQPAAALQNNICKTTCAVNIRGNIDGLALESQNRLVLQDLRSAVCPKQVTAGALEFSPGWVIDDASSTQLQSNWQHAKDSLPAHLVSPSSANVIESYFIYKIKGSGAGQLRLKEYFVLYGNRDRVRCSVRRDSTSAGLSIVSLLTSLSTILSFALVPANVKGA